MAELVERSGVPLATVKFYLREGLLMPGLATSATQAQYDENHVRRLSLVRALVAQGLPLPQVRAVVEILEAPRGPVVDAVAAALDTLPPYGSDVPEDVPRARRVLDRLGRPCDPTDAAVAQLERALAAVEDAGLVLADEHLDVYGRAMTEIARADLSCLPVAPPTATVRVAVLGTLLYEPVLTALRRIAHRTLADGYTAPDPADPPGIPTPTTTSDDTETR